MKAHELSCTFSYGITNLAKVAMRFTLDCRQSKSMTFSQPEGFVTKTVQPGQQVFMMNVEAAEGAVEFALGASVAWQEV